MLHFQVLQTFWVTFQEVPLLALNLLKSCTEIIMYVPQIVIYAVVDKEMEHKGEQM